MPITGLLDDFEQADDQDSGAGWDRPLTRGSQADGLTRGQFPQSAQPGNAAVRAADLDLVKDIPITLTVELGRARLPIGELLQLAHGSVIELDRLAGEPLDVLANGKLVARADVVTVGGKFGIRLCEVVPSDNRGRREQS